MEKDETNEKNNVIEHSACLHPSNRDFNAPFFSSRLVEQLLTELLVMWSIVHLHTDITVHNTFDGITGGFPQTDVYAESHVRWYSDSKNRTLKRALHPSKRV